MDKKIKVTLVKSLIGRKPRHLATIKGLGLRKINQSVELSIDPCILGMVNKVNYLLKVEDLS